MQSSEIVDEKSPDTLTQCKVCLDEFAKTTMIHYCYGKQIPQPAVCDECAEKCLQIYKCCPFCNERLAEFSNSNGVVVHVKQEEKLATSSNDDDLNRDMIQSLHEQDDRELVNIYAQQAYMAYQGYQHEWENDDDIYEDQHVHHDWGNQIPYQGNWDQQNPHHGDNLERIANMMGVQLEFMTDDEIAIMLAGVRLDD